MPYAGNLERADFVILLLNPGFSYTDYWGRDTCAYFQSRILFNLTQHFDKKDDGFRTWTPSSAGTVVFVWWEKKLRELVQEIVRSKFDGNYRGALQFSHRIASIELIPYHSSSFHDHGVIELLPSVAKVRAFVRDKLVPEALNDEKTIFVTRQAKAWGLTVGKNIVVYDGGHTRR